MVYKNDSPGAVYAMEEGRTGNYGYDYDSGDECVCPVCGAVGPERFYLDDDDCIGCSDCIQESDTPY